MAKLFAAVGLVPGLLIAKGGVTVMVWAGWYLGWWEEEALGLPIALVMLGVVVAYYANVMCKNYDFLTRR